MILSGTGTDGTAGAQAIKAAGGVCIAQTLDSAEFQGMPSSLIYSGYANQVLPARDIPALLIQYAGHPYLESSTDAKARIEHDLDRDDHHFKEILAILRIRTGHQFVGYRKPTVLRRIQRRMGLAGVTLLADYADMLRQNPEEALARPG